MVGRHFRALMVWVALALPATAETYDLAERYAKGHEVLVTSSSVVDSEVTGTGPSALQDAIAAMSEGLSVTQTGQVRYLVRDAAGGRPVEQEATVLKGETRAAGAPSATQALHSKIEGIPILIRAPRGGRKSYRGKSGGEIDQAEDARWCDDLPAELLEGEDVSSSRVGDSWTIKGDDLCRRLGLPEGSDGRIELTFEAVVEQDGKRLAQLAVAWTMSSAPAAGKALLSGMEMNLKGYYFIDLDTHLPYYLDLHGDSTMDLRVPDPGGAEATMSITSRLRFVLVYTLMAVGA